MNAGQNVLIAGVAPHIVVNAISTAEGGMAWAEGIGLVVFGVALVTVFGPSLRGRRRGMTRPAG